MTATSATAGCWNSTSSTSMDETFSPPEMITSFLRSEIMRYDSSSIDAAVAGVEPAVDDGLRRLLRLVPVARPSRRCCGPAPRPRRRRRSARRGPVRRSRLRRRARSAGVRSSYSARRAVHGEQRRGLGEAVDLDELPAQLGLHPLDGPGRRRRAGHHHPDCAPRPGWDRPSVAAASRIMATTAGAPHSSVTPCRSTRRRISAPSTLRRMMWRPPMPVTAYGMPQPLQWNCGSVCRYTSRSLDARVPAERGGVDPQVAMGELHALRPGRGAARVVDAGRGVLVRLPRRRARRRTGTAPRRSRRRSRSGARP